MPQRPEHNYGPTYWDQRAVCENKNRGSNDKGSRQWAREKKEIAPLKESGARNVLTHKWGKSIQLKVKPGDRREKGSGRRVNGLKGNTHRNTTRGVKGGGDTKHTNRALLGNTEEDCADKRVKKIRRGKHRKCTRLHFLKLNEKTGKKRKR